mmetsp:Transcript_23791/g.66668  ORF Transcript_23791/g.66668 Transcript_23791/m.66668 type:complete len:466 (-) Transcript_23791:31-1428(-)
MADPGVEKDPKPKSSAGEYKSEWTPQAYYNPDEDGYCPVFPDPNAKNLPISFEPMVPEHLPGVIEVEKEFLRHDTFTVGVVDQWGLEDYKVRLAKGFETTAGFVAVSNTEYEDGEPIPPNAADASDDATPDETEAMSTKAPQDGPPAVSDDGPPSIVNEIKRKRVVGFIFLDTQEDNIVWFRKLLVLRSYRRHGIGYTLAVMGVQSLEKRKIWPTAVRLFVSTNNSAAIALYQKFGMKIINVLSNYYGKGLDAHTMQFMVKKRDFATRERPKPSMEDLLAVGVLSAVGVAIRPAGEDGNPLPGFGEERYISEEVEADLQQKRKALTAKAPQQELWLPDVEDSGLVLDPLRASDLQLQGLKVCVEQSRRHKRPYPDAEYAIAGCTLCPSGAWRTSAETAMILIPEHTLHTMREVAEATRMSMADAGWEDDDAGGSKGKVPAGNQGLALHGLPEKFYVTSLEHLGFF